ncbi:MAG TPA: PilC/PilY family type IV pilus protein, partial [Thermoanaerobaculia bacterium]|nr:PilC/PilY family type IV pilus protein [Thermoanaerobaculia bacterium]
MSCRSHHPSRRLLPRGKAAAALGLAALTVLLLPGAPPASSNDVDLLRFNTAKPYVFFILDTSASMTLSPQGQWVHANGDDPRSKLYQAKKVVYEVMSAVDDVHFGFAAFNQDKSAVRAKHWLYYSTTALPGGWPINYPRPDADGPVQIQADGTAVSDVEGDLMTFGGHVDATGIAGTCTAPLLLTSDLEKINRYAKLGASGNGPTKIWLKGGTGNKTYRLTVTRPGNKPDTSLNQQLGRDGMNVRFQLEEVRASNGCTGPDTANFQATHNLNLDLKLWTDFLMFDEPNGVTAPGTSKAGGVDPVAGYWDYKDILDTASCGSGHPFSGKGWEGNYDGASGSVPPASVTPSLKPTDDPYCLVAGDPSTCYNVKRPTTYDPFGRPLDRGDVLPLDWRTENKTEFLSRLAPSQSDGAPDFRIASYFKDFPEASTGVLALKESGESPLMGTGPSPLGKSVIDFRCWYLGDGNKCNDSAYAPGWEAVAQRYDKEWGCRRPYLIVISDGGDSCAGENPCADTANLNSKGGIRTWVMAYGADCSKAGNPLKCMAQNGKGELVCPQTANDLKAELQRILGLIREEARSFASAAVPSVQAIVEDKIFLTNFTPLNGRSTWDGHVHSFLKPLPLRPTDNRPDLAHENHLWDAGEVLKTQVKASDPVGPADDQRRVYYPTRVSGVPGRLLEPVPLDDSTATGKALRRDLWDGFGIGYTPGDFVTEAAAEIKVRSVLQTTYSLKTHTTTVTDPVTGKPTTKTLQYVLGDIFHSNPLVIGSPSNTRYFADDASGYRDFFRQQEMRRKLLLVGGNDGMMHAFEAGLPRVLTGTDPTTGQSRKYVQFDNGSGKEVFAFMPREVMPAVRKMAESNSHQWGVDGTVSVGDVYIDPLRKSTPERSWRTVVVGGLREGGSSYYALDITAPDKVSLENLTDGDTYVPTADGTYRPSCAGDGGAYNAARCGPVPFPYVLWEFTDAVKNVGTGALVRLDEDLNGHADLGYTWSVPNIGRIRVREGGDVVDKYVAIVGGGFDPSDKLNPKRGTWLYMIDVETGQAIYKRQLVGAVPSEPAAVDTNQDGYLDRIYVGTTLGKVYRVDLNQDAAGEYPALANTSVRGLDGATYS